MYLQFYVMNQGENRSESDERDYSHHQSKETSANIMSQLLPCFKSFNLISDLLNVLIGIREERFHNAPG